MSTGTVPADDGTGGSVRTRRDTGQNDPSLVAELVFRELVEADAALSEAELRERTLLPAAEVRAALAELDDRGLCTTRRRTTDNGPRRYVASLPADAGD